MAQTPERWEWRWKSNTLHVLTDNPAYRYGRAVLSIDHDADGRPYIVVSDEHAALIAAAPEMREALEALIADAILPATTLFHVSPRVIEQARAALAKACGEEAPS